MLSHGEYNSTPPVLTVGKPHPLQLDVNGRLLTSSVSGGVYNATPPTLTDGQRGDSQLDANGNTLVSQGTGLNAVDDEVTAKPKAPTPVNLTASGQILSVPGQIVGFYVNSTSSGTIRFSDALTATTPYLGAAITPAVGYHPFPSKLTTGGYATIANTLDVTVFVIPD